MPIYADQTGKTIFLHGPPQRIISLVPSLTAFLADLGLDAEIIGITKFCVYPEGWIKRKTIIGGTKNINFEIIKKLEPDFIIANREENVKEQVLNLSKDFPVWISHIDNLKHAYEMMQSIGTILNREEKAAAIIDNIKKNFFELVHPKKSIDCCYLIWQNPYMTIGHDTFIHHIMDVAGLKNIFADHERYPQISLASIKARNPEVLLLSSEPYPFKQTHIHELQKEFPGTLIVLADGQMFSWYGSHLLQTPAYLRNLIDEITANLTSTSS